MTRYHAPKYHLVAGRARQPSDKTVLLESECDALAAALEETLQRITDFRVWFEDEYDGEFVEPVLTEVAKLGLTGRAEATLDAYRAGRGEG